MRFDRAAFFASAPPEGVVAALRELPTYLVLEPRGGVRLPFTLDATACELELRLETERPGASFIAMVSQRDGTWVQRVRLATSAKILFDPGTTGDFVLQLTNPTFDPIVLRLRGRSLPVRPPRRTPTHRRARRSARARPAPD